MARALLPIAIVVVLIFSLVQYRSSHVRTPATNSTVSATDTPPAGTSVAADGAAYEIDFTSGLTGSPSIGNTLAMTNVLTLPIESALAISTTMDIPLTLEMWVTPNLTISSTNPTCVVCDESEGYYKWSLIADAEEPISVDADVNLSGSVESDTATIRITISGSTQPEISRWAKYAIVIDPITGSIDRRY